MSNDILDDILREETEDESSVNTVNTVNTVNNKEIKKVEVENSKIEKEDTSEILPGVGVDVGTSNIVVARQTKDGTFVNRYHRDMLYPLEASEETQDLLDRSDYLYVKAGNKFYIVGDDALKLKNAINEGEIVRPMKDGLLNPSLKESSELLFYIIKAVVGDPIVPNEPLRFSVPANPVDQNYDNKFHQLILTNFFKKLGYDPKPVNEAMAICYDCNPIMKSEDEGDVPLSGISLSSGGGMTNIALSFKGMELSAFSVTKSGDYIDDSAAQVTGVSSSKVLRKKEKELDLANPDMSDNILSALWIYYDEITSRFLHQMSKAFTDKGTEIEGDVEIVVAGGTSLPNGFCEMIQSKLSDYSFPFKIYRVRHSETPFYSVSQGSSIRAQADYKKSLK